MNGQTQAFYDRTMHQIATYLRDELGLIPCQFVRNRTDNPRSVYAVRRATNNPRTIAIQIAINPRYLNDLIALRENLSMAVGLDSHQSLRIVRGQAGMLAVEIPKPEGLWFNIGVADLPKGEGLKAVVGLDQSSRPSTINFGHTLTPHMLIAGTTGSGKTNAEQLLVHNLASYNTPQDIRIVLIDVEKRGLRWRVFNHLAHLAHPVVTDETEAQRVLAWSVAEIDRRREQQRTSPRLFLFVDEMQSLVQLDGVVAPIARIAEMGREYGVHFVGAVQNPTKENIGHSDIQRCIPTRLVGRVANATAAYVATNQRSSGADQLTGAGDFLTLQPGQSTQRVTVALLTEKDIATLPRCETRPAVLTMDDIGDVERVLNVSKKPGRPQDDYDWHTVGQLVGELAQRGEINPHSARRWFNLGLPKAERFLSVAEGVLGGLRQSGFDIIKVEQGQTVN
jgi:hypothetical protein